MTTYHSLLLVILLIGGLLDVANCLHCYQCTDVDEHNVHHECNREGCDGDEDMCYSVIKDTSHGRKATLECRKQSHCPGGTHHSSQQHHHHGKRDTIVCEECCYSDNCNRLCSGTRISHILSQAHNTQAPATTTTTTTTTTTPKPVTYATECLVCQKEDHTNCVDFQSCHANQVCYIQEVSTQSGSRYLSGCTDSNTCQTVKTDVISQSSHGDKVIRGSCCHSANCNTIKSLPPRPKTHLPKSTAATTHGQGTTQPPQTTVAHHGYASECITCHFDRHSSKSQCDHTETCQKHEACWLQELVYGHSHVLHGGCIDASECHKVNSEKIGYSWVPEKVIRGACCRTKDCNHKDILPTLHTTNREHVSECVTCKWGGGFLLSGLGGSFFHHCEEHEQCIDGEVCYLQEISSGFDVLNAKFLHGGCVKKERCKDVHKDILEPTMLNRNLVRGTCCFTKDCNDENVFTAQQHSHTQAPSTTHAPHHTTAPHHTHAPTTQAPTTQAPTTQASTTQAPTTKPIHQTQKGHHQGSHHTQAPSHTSDPHTADPHATDHHTTDHHTTDHHTTDHHTTDHHTTTTVKSTTSKTTVATTVNSTQAPITVTTTPAGPTPIKCAVCSGPMCGLMAGRDKVEQCPADKPFCLNEVDNSLDGRKTYTKTCASVRDCDTRWWQESSDQPTCTQFNPLVTYSFKFSCFYCCVTDNCNEDIFPKTQTLYRP